ncbi:MAG: hypothetical protein F4204_06185 [Rhodospirillaceae bacterium]|nr:hypothetical protein [Rhodospirillaceae bacterium]
MALDIGAASAQSAAADRETAAPGRVCVGTRGFGVACLAGGVWTRWTEARGALDSDFVYAIAACHGRIVVSTGRRLHEFDGERRRLTHWTPGSPARRIACDPTGGYWIIGGRTLAKWTGRTWLSHGIDEVLTAARADWIEGLAIERNGNLWVVAGKRIAARFDGTDWQLFRAGAGLPARWRVTGVHAGRDGSLWLTHDRGLARRHGRAWNNTAGPGSASVMTDGPDGALWLGYFGRITRYRNEFWTRFALAAPVKGLAADNRGRIWAATRYGLGVYDNGQWRWRRMADSALPSNDLAGVAVLGAGAGLPRPLSKPPGGLAFRLVRQGGGALANARVDICAAPPGRVLRSGRSPCHGRPLHRVSKTDATGRVSFGNLPPADYYPAVLPPEEELWLIGDSGRRTRVTAGQHSDIGSLYLRAVDNTGAAR